jgi:DNA invertase Pin-like site-specific DNA recombinase
VSCEMPIASGRSMLPTRAAQYVRMSRDTQRYSTANQAEVIAAYAQDRNVTIVRTYADEGLEMAQRLAFVRFATSAPPTSPRFSAV